MPLRTHGPGQGLDGASTGSRGRAREVRRCRAWLDRRHHDGPGATGSSRCGRHRLRRSASHARNESPSVARRPRPPVRGHANRRMPRWKRGRRPGQQAKPGGVGPCGCRVQTATTETSRYRTSVSRSRWLLSVMTMVIIAAMGVMMPGTATTFRFTRNASPSPASSVAPETTQAALRQCNRAATPRPGPGPPRPQGPPRPNSCR
jgi:hypothetical protein